MEARPHADGEPKGHEEVEVFQHRLDEERPQKGKGEADALPDRHGRVGGAAGEEAEEEVEEARTYIIPLNPLIRFNPLNHL